MSWILLAGALLAGGLLGTALERERWVRVSRASQPRTVRVGGREYWVGDNSEPCTRCGCAVFRRRCICCRRGEVKEVEP